MQIVNKDNNENSNIEKISLSDLFGDVKNTVVNTKENPNVEKIYLKEPKIEKSVKEKVYRKENNAESFYIEKVKPTYQVVSKEVKSIKEKMPVEKPIIKSIEVVSQKPIDKIENGFFDFQDDSFENINVLPEENRDIEPVIVRERGEYSNFNTYNIETDLKENINTNYNMEKNLKEDINTNYNIEKNLKEDINTNYNIEKNLKEDININYDTEKDFKKSINSNNQKIKYNMVDREEKQSTIDKTNVKDNMIESEAKNEKSKSFLPPIDDNESIVQIPMVGIPMVGFENNKPKQSATHQSKANMKNGRQQHKSIANKDRPQSRVGMSIGMPNLETEMPEMNLEKPSIEGKMPEMNIGKPSIEGKMPEMNIGKPSIEGKMPEMNIGKPSIEAKMPEMNIGIPNIEAEMPEMNIGMPSKEAEMPEMNIEKPSIEAKMPEMNIGIPNIEAKMPEMNIGKPSIEAKMPEMNIGKPSIEAKMPEMNIEKPSIEAEMPEMNIGMPSIEGKMPEMNIGMPNIEAEMPEMNIGMPNIEGKMPEMNIGIPNIEGKMPEMNIGKPSIEAEMPEMNIGIPNIEAEMPEMNIGMPSIEAEMPEMNIGMPSIEAEMPEMNIGMPGIETQSNNHINKNLYETETFTEDTDELIDVDNKNQNYISNETEKIFENKKDSILKLGEITNNISLNTQSNINQIENDGIKINYNRFKKKHIKDNIEQANETIRLENDLLNDNKINDENNLKTTELYENIDDPMHIKNQINTSKLMMGNQFLKNQHIGNDALLLKANGLNNGLSVNNLKQTNQLQNNKVPEIKNDFGSLNQSNITNAGITQGNMFNGNQQQVNIAGNNLGQVNKPNSNPMVGNTLQQGNILSKNQPQVNMPGSSFSQGSLLNSNQALGNSMVQGNTLNGNQTQPNMTSNGLLQGNVSNNNQISGNSFMQGNGINGNMSKMNVQGNVPIQGNMLSGNVAQASMQSSNLVQGKDLNNNQLQANMQGNSLKTNIQKGETQTLFGSSVGKKQGEITGLSNNSLIGAAVAGVGVAAGVSAIKNNEEKQLTKREISANKRAETLSAMGINTNASAEKKINSNLQQNSNVNDTTINLKSDKKSSNLDKSQNNKKKQQVNIKKQKGKVNNPKSKKMSLILKIGPVILAIIAAILFFTLGTFKFTVAADSMAPTLKTGDSVLATKVFKGTAIQRGDVIIFNKMVGGQKQIYIKRVVGLPGDKVEIKSDGVVYINSQQLIEKYIEHIDTTAYDMGTVPKGEYLVLGDNRANSRDSRMWDSEDDRFVQRKDIYGKARFISSPLSRTQFLMSK